MSLAHVAEAKITEAIAAGEFDDLPGAGRPQDLDGYFAAPVAYRAGFGFLKSAGVVPPEVAALREVATLRDKLATEADPARRDVVRAELAARQLELDMALERMKRALRQDATAG